MVELETEEDDNAGVDAVVRCETGTDSTRVFRSAIGSYNWQLRANSFASQGYGSFVSSSWLDVASARVGFRGHLYAWVCEQILLWMLCLLVKNIVLIRRCFSAVAKRLLLTSSMTGSCRWSQANALSPKQLSPKQLLQVRQAYCGEAASQVFGQKRRPGADQHNSH